MFGGLTGEGQDVTLDVSHFDVSSATNLNYMFSGFGYTCTGYEDWDVSHVDGFASMFYGFHGGEDHVIDLSH